MSENPTSTEMSNRGLLLALAPAAVLGLALLVLMWGTFQRDLAAADDRLGQSIVQRIAIDVRDGVAAGDAVAVGRVAQMALRDAGVLSVTVESADGKQIVHAAASGGAPSESWLRRRLAGSVPPAVYTARVGPAGDPAAAAAATTTAGYGRVVLQISRVSSVARQLTVLGLALLASLIVLGTAAAVTLRRRRELRNRLQRLLDTLRDYETGRFATRVAVGPEGTLANIELCVNAVADAMERFQQDLQIQVDRATRELRQTLEEVEIKNVQLDLARKRAVGASQAKSDFLANMSHEIRTPMNAVVGYTQLLARTTLDEDQRGYLETIQGAADSLLGIIDDILNLSRLEAGEFAVQERAYSVRECVNQLVELLAPSAFRKGLDFYRIVDHRVPDTVLGDPLRIRQVLTNLLSNAIKFTESGQVSLLVHVNPGDGGGELVFTVLDTGVGIADEDRARIFQPFARGEDAEKALTGGTGLGLTISRRLCEAMGGHIQARSTRGEGSRLTVTLPLMVADTAAPPELPAIEGMRVAVYAADQDFCAWIFEWLEHAGALARVTRDLDQLQAARRRLVDETGDDADVFLAVLGAADLRGDIDLRTAWPGEPVPPIVALLSSQDRAELHELATRQGCLALPACAGERTIAEALCDAAGRPRSLPDSARPPVADVTAAAVAADATPLTVLIAEDNEINRRYLTKILDLNGVASESCANGEEAVALATSGRFDAVLMDIRMPRMDGVEATRLIREAPQVRRLPIIGLTASALPEERLRYMSQGLDECLVKPVKPDMLVNMIRRMAGATPDTDERLDGEDTSLDPELLSLLREELPGRVERIVAARRTGDFASLRGEVHKINGAAAVLRLHELWRAAGAVESRLVAGDTGRIDEPLRELVAQVESILD